MLKPILLVDIDDVIWDLLKAWVEYLNTRYGTSVSWEEIDEWDMKKSFPMLTDKQIYEMFTELDFWMSVQPKIGAVEALKILQAKFNIYLLSATSVRTISVKSIALRDKFPMIDENHMIFCNNKQLVQGEYLIDDKLDNLIGGKYKKILFTAPHNKNIEIPEDIIRCDSWSDVLWKGISEI